MKTSERVLQFLKEQGFCPKVDADGDIIFKCQMRTFLFKNHDEDEEYFQLALPGIYDVTEDNRDVVLEATNRVTSMMKVAKTIVTNDSVWVLFEILLDSTPEVSDIIPRALAILVGAQEEFYKQIR